MRKRLERPDIRDQVILSPEDVDLKDQKMTLHNQYAQFNSRRLGYLEVHRVVGARIGLLSSRKTPMDHINRNKLDNRRENLRIVKPRENQLNSDRLDKAERVQKQGERWCAQIDIEGKTHHLGMFPTREEAVEAYKESKAANRPIVTRKRPKGCVFIPSRGVWHAYIKIGKKATFIGRFKTEAEASQAYRDFRAKQGFDPDSKFNRPAQELTA